jgi:hypothetical protein
MVCPRFELGTVYLKLKGFQDKDENNELPPVYSLVRLHRKYRLAWLYTGGKR